MDSLFLGSQSSSRKELLQKIDIPFIVIDQSADEMQCDWGLPFPNVVENIALYKMEHIILPNKVESSYVFVLTADTLAQTKDGTINGKPMNVSEARFMLRNARSGGKIATSFCLDKKVFVSGQWEMDKRIIGHAEAELVFDVPDEWIAIYLDSSSALTSSGSITIEGFGSQFLRSIRGSYSAVVGLPLFELRMALTDIGFFKH